MIPLDVGSERVLRYYYDNRGFHGINEVRNKLGFSEDRMSEIIIDLETRNFFLQMILDILKRPQSNMVQRILVLEHSIK